MKKIENNTYQAIFDSETQKIQSVLRTWGYFFQKLGLRQILRLSGQNVLLNLSYKTSMQIVI